MSKLKTILSRLISDNSFRDSFLKDAALATKEYNLSEAELAGLQTIDISNTQNIEERVSKSFLAIDIFTAEIENASTTRLLIGSGSSGSGSGSGCGCGGCGSGTS